MTTSATPQPPEIPFTVQGYITDPKQVGYQILTNYESTYWRALVGNDAWGLYEVLRSFCHGGNGTCHPSIRLLAAMLGLKETRVLTGWVKTVKGKEYRYHGLIEILQQYELVIAEIQGEGATMRYLFHVNLTPGLLVDAQLQKLPAILQKKHADLLARCQKEREVLTAKRRPSKIAQGSGKLPGGSGNLPDKGGNLPIKQHPINITHRTPSSAREDHNNNSGDSPEQTTVVVASLPSIPEQYSEFPQNHPQEKQQLTPAPSSVEEHSLSLDLPSPPVVANQECVQALISQGIAPQVAQRLATRYRPERVTEKIDFLVFLLEEQPEKVQNPRGWLRRAIEEDYGAPDGYISAEERARRTAEEAAQEEAVAVFEQQKQEFAARLAAQEAAFRQQLTERYGTTEADEQLWQEVLLEFKYGQPDLYSLFSSAQILSADAERVQLGFTHEMSMLRLQHPGTLTALKRTLKRIGGCPLEVVTVLIPAEGNNGTHPSTLC